MTETARIAWAAGEASGDLIAAPVIAQMSRAASGVAHAGICGPAMQGAGCVPWVGIDELSVRGYAEVVRELPRLLRLRKQVRQRVIDWRASLFVGVDAPDFNFSLERRLREAGIRTIHFVGPSVWAWRAKRLDKIRRSVDHMLLVFPFEAPLYEAAGIDATYVGHPLADQLDPQRYPQQVCREALGVISEGPVVCLMPGSRLSEVAYMGGLFADTVRWLVGRDPTMRFILPAANEVLRERLLQCLGSLDSSLGGPVRLLSGDAHRGIAAADAVLVASGTATLEVALLRKPMVITYKMSALSYRIMRRMALQPWVGLPNILCRDEVVPEILQDAATPASLGAAVLRMLEPTTRDRVVERFGDLREAMAIGCAHRAAEVIAGQLA